MFRLSKSLFISKKVISLLFEYNHFPIEVGGLLYGTIEDDITEIKTYTFKKGNSNEIEFTEEDALLFVRPNGQILVGTWHTHPNDIESKASNKDLEQWSLWDKNLHHLIVAYNNISIYKNNQKLTNIELNN